MNFRFNCFESSSVYEEHERGEKAESDDVETDRGVVFSREERINGHQLAKAVPIVSSGVLFNFRRAACSVPLKEEHSFGEERLRTKETIDAIGASEVSVEGHDGVGFLEACDVLKA